ncbi:hypothetical protein D9613_003168 [Agrocybe pediades]|uniref:Uncharacterized protein n=1 Tax=Agrocybe pediades TaxID=84607 RepID=A0A8H4QP79_9AGAR|nr:hypothetical protein D9613_003168 [Agrocybe pediades]
MASCPPSYAWAQNSKGLDPCGAAAELLRACQSDLPEQLPQLPFRGKNAYPVPSKELGLISDCSCSVPVYALVSACADCQNGTFPTWAIFSASCSEHSQKYPFNPPATPIPRWAFIDINLQPSFDRVIAQKLATSSDSTTANTTPIHPSTSTPKTTVAQSSTVSQAGEAAASAISTSSLTQTPTHGEDQSTSTPPSPAQNTHVTNHSDDGLSFTPTSSQLDTSPAITQGSNNIPNSDNGDSESTSSNALGTAKKSSSAGAIAGGVVGGLFALIILAGVLVWWARRRRRSRIAPSTAYLAQYGATRPQTSMSNRPLGLRTDSIAMSQHNSNSVSSYHDEDVRDSIYSTGDQKSRYAHPLASPGFHGP